MEATAIASEYALGELVTIEALYQDRYGRLVAIVILKDGFSLQAVLLSKGMAWVAPRYCKRPECKTWSALEEMARQERRGLWRNTRPTPPWEWRKQN